MRTWAKTKKGAEIQKLKEKGGSSKKKKKRKKKKKSEATEATEDTADAGSPTPIGSFHILLRIQ